MTSKDNEGEIFNHFSMNDSYIIADLLNKNGIRLQHHLHKSFIKLIKHDLPNYFIDKKHIIYEKELNGKIYSNYYIFSNLQIKPPMNRRNQLIYPSNARQEDLTYESRITITVEQKLDIINISTDEMETKTIGEIENDKTLFKIPTMVKSPFCSINLEKPEEPLDEDENDQGGYFIIKGSEKAIISQNRHCDNKTIVLKKKDNGVEFFEAHIYSRNYLNPYIVKTFYLRYKKNILIISDPAFKIEIPLIILLKALGMENDKEIVNYISFGKLDDNLVLKIIIDNIMFESKIKTKDQAIDYLVDKLKYNKIFESKVSQTDEDVAKIQKKKFLEKILKEELLPHLQNNMMVKAKFICEMTHDLIYTVLKRRDVDDRDSYTNKRIVMVGQLMMELIVPAFKKILSRIQHIYKSKDSKDNIESFNIIKEIETSIIDTVLKSAMSSGLWNNDSGVAQMMYRLTNLLQRSFLTRIDTQEREGTKKLTHPLQLAPSSIGFLDPSETPEHKGVGKTLYLNMCSTITVIEDIHTLLIKSSIEEYDDFKNILYMTYDNLKYHTRIYLNGVILGTCENAFRLYNYLYDLRIKGYFHPMSSIIHNIYERKIIIYCDSGRLVRPIFKVKNNNLIISKEKLLEIKKIKSFEQFILQYSDCIEYIDVDMQCNALIADTNNTLKKSFKEMNYAKKLKSDEDQELLINRYDDRTYVLYTHQEIHPSLLLGQLASTTPFINHDQGVRAIYRASQGRQAKCVPCSNFRSETRMDLTHFLWHPQKQLVKTRTQDYLHFDKYPNGENCIVAIACYTGYNQEDSLIFNKGSIERGLFCSGSFKKYESTSQKNHGYSQDDQFTKPNEQLVDLMQFLNYDKLNNKGFVPVETKVVNSDVLLGKVIPIPKNEAGKMFKDKSEYYKSSTPAFVDSVSYEKYNEENYEMRKIKLRQERKPKVGDKFSSTHGQKGTIGIILNESDMPHTKEGIRPDIIVNPNAFPSRRTIGQLLESLFGKVGGLLFTYMDGTPFNDFDIKEIEEKLIENGYDADGTEYLYDGTTGKKIKSKIFIGVTFYQRLRHLVDEKKHARAYGTKTNLTRQPAKGRSREGGLRLGEMERDAVIAHGISLFQGEKWCDNSDIYKMFICDMCGMMASRKKANKDPNVDMYECKSCNNSTRITMMICPYVLKLLFQELLAMNIKASIKF